MPKLLVSVTYGKNDADRATIPFVVANAALASGQEVVAFLTIEGVRLAIQGYADDIHAAGFAPLKDLLAAFAEGGGKLWVCPPCFKVRELDQKDLAPNASLAGGAAVAAYLAEGAASMSY